MPLTFTALRPAVLTSALLVACIVLAPTCHGQTELDRTVVTGKTEPAPEPIRSAADASAQPSDSLTAVELSRIRFERIEDIAALTPGVGRGISQGGLGNALVVRGIELSNRVYLNGQLDYPRVFVRDASTIDSIALNRGPASAPFGFGAPGAVVQIFTPPVVAHPTAQVGLSVGGREFARADFKLGSACGEGCAWLTTGAWQQGLGDIRGADPDRQNVLAKVALKGNSDLRVRLETEQQINRRQYDFGTIILKSGPVYDVSYNAPHSSAYRRYERASVDAEIRMGCEACWLKAAYTNWHSFRDEALVGFLSIESQSRLSGYFTHYIDQARQESSLVQWRGSHARGGYALQTMVGWEYNLLHSTLSGSQRVNGFSLDPLNPNFDGIDPAAGAVKRYRVDRTVDESSFVAFRLALPTDTTLSAGWRGSRFLQALTRVEGNALVPSFTGRDASWQLGVQHPVGAQHSVYLNAAQVVEPNAGVDASGQFLPLKRARQSEAGWRYRSGPIEGGAAIFDIVRRGDAAPDPKNPDASLPLGERRYRGVELQGRTSWRAAFLRAHLAYLQTSTPSLTPGLPAAHPTNAPRLSGGGSLGTTAQFGGVTIEPWLALTAAAKRFASADNTVTVAGYTRYDAGLNLAVSNWDINFVAQNLADKRYIAAVTAPENAVQGERRLWRLGVSVRY